MNLRGFRSHRYSLGTYGMPVVCPASDRFATPSGSRNQTRVPTQLLGKTSSRLSWLALLVLVSSLLLFFLRHFLQPELRELEKQLAFRLDISILILAPLVVILV